MATTLEQLAQGTATTLLSSELNSLANNANAISSVGGSSGIFTNTQATSNFNGYVRAKLQVSIGIPGGSLNSGSGFSIWFLKTLDGSTFEDGSSSITPARNNDVFVPVRAASTAQVITMACWVPVGQFYVLFQNNGTGQALAATGNTVKILPETDQAV